jgi:hypothetical protein
LYPAIPKFLGPANIPTIKINLGLQGRDKDLQGRRDRRWHWGNNHGPLPWRIDNRRRRLYNYHRGKRKKHMAMDKRTMAMAMAMTRVMAMVTDEPGTEKAKVRMGHTHLYRKANTACKSRAGGRKKHSHSQKD